MSLEFSPQPPQRQEKPSYMQEMKDAISKSPERLKTEYETTENPWLVCLNTDLGGISLCLDLAFEKKEIDESEYEKLKEKLKILSGKVSWLLKIFKVTKDESGKIIDKDGGLPQSVKDRLAEDLKFLSV